MIRRFFGNVLTVLVVIGVVLAVLFSLIGALTIGVWVANHFFPPADSYYDNDGAEVICGSVAVLVWGVLGAAMAMTFEDFGESDS